MTMFAFASLLVGEYRGIRSLGLVMTIGVIACLIAALALLPALLETRAARAGRCSCSTAAWRKRASLSPECLAR